MTLSYQDWSTDWFPPMAREMLSRFYAFNPDIIVFYTPDPDDLAEAMLEEMRAGTAPDVTARVLLVLPDLGPGGPPARPPTLHRA